MIEFEQFAKYYGKRCAVRSLDLTIGEGEVFAFLGPNGGGKTTILRALVGLHSPTNGRILVGGLDVMKDPVKVKSMISYLPQRVSAPDRLTAREVLKLHAALKGVSDDRVDSVLNTMVLHEDADRYLREFSGGMMQRLGLAIAFLAEMDILVLDEPTLNLDPLGIDLFRDLVRDLKKKGTTIVLSSHIVRDAEQLADRVGIIVEGRLEKVEPIKKFRASLSRETQMRVVLNTTENGVMNTAVKSGASEAFYDGKSFIFKAAPEQRMAIIHAIEATGVAIEEVHTEPPNWEILIGEHFKSREKNDESG
jgi:ABC-type multidrug transport system ATPase subunit